MMLAGVPVPDDTTATLATMCRVAGAEDLADRLDRALADEVKLLALMIDERMVILDRLDDPPDDLVVLRAVLLNEHEWRQRAGSTSETTTQEAQEETGHRESPGQEPSSAVPNHLYAPIVNHDGGKIASAGGERAAYSIGKIERVPLRDVWKHEAHNLTTWLEDNIDVLNDVLDLEAGPSGVPQYGFVAS